MLHHHIAVSRTKDLGEAILNTSLPPPELEASTATLSVILPAKNEAESLKGLLTRLRATLPQAELIVLDDGSSDRTADVARAHGAQLVSHPYSFGNGAAVKSGARAATGEIL